MVHFKRINFRYVNYISIKVSFFKKVTDSLSKNTITTMYVGIYNICRSKMYVNNAVRPDMEKWNYCKLLIL